MANTSVSKLILSVAIMVVSLQGLFALPVTTPTPTLPTNSESDKLKALVTGFRVLSKMVRMRTHNSSVLLQI